MSPRGNFCGNPWGLTDREARVVWMLAAFQTKCIADRLGITVAGVQDVLRRVYRKMDVHHAAAAAVEFDRWWQGAKRNLADATVRLFEIELLELEPAR